MNTSSKLPEATSWLAENHITCRHSRHSSSTNMQARHDRGHQQRQLGLQIGHTRRGATKDINHCVSCHASVDVLVASMELGIRLPTEGGVMWQKGLRKYKASGVSEPSPGWAATPSTCPGVWSRVIMGEATSMAPCILHQWGRNGPVSWQTCALGSDHRQTPAATGRGTRIARTRCQRPRPRPQLRSQASVEGARLRELAVRARAGQARNERDSCLALQRSDEVASAKLPLFHVPHGQHTAQATVTRQGSLQHTSNHLSLCGTIQGDLVAV